MDASRAATRAAIDLNLAASRSAAASIFFCSRLSSLETVVDCGLAMLPKTAESAIRSGEATSDDSSALRMASALDSARADCN